MDNLKKYQKKEPTPVITPHLRGSKLVLFPKGEPVKFKSLGQFPVVKQPLHTNSPRSSGSGQLQLVVSQQVITPNSQTSYYPEGSICKAEAACSLVFPEVKNRGPRNMRGCFMARGYWNKEAVREQIKRKFITNNRKFLFDLAPSEALPSPLRVVKKTICALGFPRGKLTPVHSIYKSNKRFYNFKKGNTSFKSQFFLSNLATAPSGRFTTAFINSRSVNTSAVNKRYFGALGFPPRGKLRTEKLQAEKAKQYAKNELSMLFSELCKGQQKKIKTAIYTFPSTSFLLGTVVPQTPCGLPSLTNSDFIMTGRFKFNKTNVLKQNYVKYNLETYHRSNQDTCLIQKPAVKEGDWIQTGDLLADSASSIGGELAIGHNIIVAYMPWEGYNYEDAILINERLVYEDIYTSIHIERYEVLTKDTKLGSEQITREIPDTNENEISHLDKNGIAKIGSWVEEGDILVGKITPFNIKTLTPQQKLLYKIFDKELSTTKDSSLRAPKGIKANVINVNILARQKIELKAKSKKEEKADALKPKLALSKGTALFNLGTPGMSPRFSSGKTAASEKQKQLYASLQVVNKDKSLPSYVHVYLAEKRKMQVGDKMAGRHGNKGIVSRILPRQDMPFMPDGTSVDIVLNPLGVPSRMNVGQIYECLLGLAGLYLGEHYKIPPFDEMYGADASRSFVLSKLYDARKKTGLNWLFDPNNPGKIRLFDGRNSECFDQTVTVGIAYVLKLVHMVDDKLHMRSTGPYSLVTQQPLRGRSKQGGQRLGEMEVWAIEGYGAAFVLSEMLTIKSDDMTGRQNLWKNLIENNDISLGSPESFKVLICELQALCLDIGLFRKNVTKQEVNYAETNDALHTSLPGSLFTLSERLTKGQIKKNKESSAPNLIEIDSLLHLA